MGRVLSQSWYLNPGLSRTKFYRGGGGEEVPGHKHGSVLAVG